MTKLHDLTVLKHTQILAVKIRQNSLQNRTGRTDCENHKMLKCWRPPTIHKILAYIKMFAPMKCRRPKMSAP